MAASEGARRLRLNIVAYLSSQAGSADFEFEVKLKGQAVDALRSVSTPAKGGVWLPALHCLFLL